jgi:hypothetical protein
VSHSVPLEKRNSALVAGADNTESRIPS